MKEYIKKINKNKKYLLLFLGIILFINTAVSMYFLNRFYIGTSLNGVDISCKTIEEVEDILKSKEEEYNFKVKGRDEANIDITGKEIGFKYKIQDEIAKLKITQPSFMWIIGLLDSKELKSSKIITYDEDKLKKLIEKSSLSDHSNKRSPKDATYTYSDNIYTLVKEEEGNKVNKDKLMIELDLAIRRGEEFLDLEEKKCYEEPTIKSNHIELNKAIETLNKYIESEIVYNVLDKKYIVDKDRISNWLYLNEKYQVIIDEEKVKSFMNELVYRYNSIARIRDFKTSMGSIVQVHGGDYGISVDTSKEIQELISLIKAGKTEEREPEFSQSVMANINNIGNTYVEINLTTQYLWVYKNGALIAEGSIVTGNADGKHDTPQGIYRLKYKQKNAILRGADYEVPVTFWMPFNGDIGLHDATWRSSFGGSIYRYSGSHGCVNCPYNLAQQIFNNIPAGAPIVCYY